MNNICGSFVIQDLNDTTRNGKKPRSSKHERCVTQDEKEKEKGADLSTSLIINLQMI